MFGDGDTFKISSRGYMGCKTRLLSLIRDVFREECTGVNVVADLFAGTGVVSDYFNSEGCELIVNDFLYHNYLSHVSFFDSTPVDVDKLQGYIDLFNSYTGTEDNYFSEKYGGAYFRLDNARKIGWIRNYIDSLDDLSFREEAILVCGLVYGADYCANVCGHYSSFLKFMGTDGRHDFDMRLPEFHDEMNTGNKCFNMDANRLASSVSADLVYLDPPYTTDQYYARYHVLENLAVWNKPDLDGKTRLPPQRFDFKSDYSSKRKALDTFRDLIYSLDGVDYLLVSYSNSPNNIFDMDALMWLLEEKGTVEVFRKQYPKMNTKDGFDDKSLYEQLFLCKV